MEVRAHSLRIFFFWGGGVGGGGSIYLECYSRFLTLIGNSV